MIINDDYNDYNDNNDDNDNNDKWILDTEYNTRSNLWKLDGNLIDPSEFGFSLGSFNLFFLFFNYVFLQLLIFLFGGCYLNVAI